MAKRMLEESNVAAIRSGDLTPFETRRKAIEEARLGKRASTSKPAHKGAKPAPARAASTSSPSSYEPCELQDSLSDSGNSIADRPSTSKSASDRLPKRKTTRSRELNQKRRPKDDGDERYFIERRRQVELEESVGATETHYINDDYFVAKHVWDRLYKYQKTGVRWLHELHAQYVGGILADEMGLGKTIQICIFLRSLAQSQQPSRAFKYKGLGPSLVVCPATLMHQWVRELNTWFPLCRVAVLHASGVYTGPKHRLIYKMGTWKKDGSILVTSYSTYIQESKALATIDWHYVVLDEGHKIR